MTDEQLAARGAFNDLYLRWRAPVYQFLRRRTDDASLADDLFQATWLKAFRGLEAFRGESSFKTWLFTIAHRCVVDQGRAKAPFEPLPDVPAPAAEDRTEQVEAVKRALAGMSEAHRSLFLLVRFSGMRIAEAGAVVGLTAGSAKVTLLRVQRRLGEILGRVNA